jgi:hypothetical protein
MTTPSRERWCWRRRRGKGGRRTAGPIRRAPPRGRSRPGRACPPGAQVAAGDDAGGAVIGGEVVECPHCGDHDVAVGAQRVDALFVVEIEAGSPLGNVQQRAELRLGRGHGLPAQPGDDGVAVPLKPPRDFACVRHTGIIGGPDPCRQSLPPERDRRGLPCRGLGQRAGDQLSATAWPPAPASRRPGPRPD